MDKIEEILPRICEYLTKDLSREKLSPVAEATRLFYVERLKATGNYNDDKKYENNSQSQIQQLKNLIGKKLGGDKSAEMPEKKNGFVVNDSLTNSNESQLNTRLSSHSLDNRRISNEVSLRENQKEQISGEYYDSEFDSSDENNENLSRISAPFAQKSSFDESYSSATFKGEFFQNILLKMRKRTCYLVGSDLICISKSKERSKFSVLNCKSSVKQHEGKYPIEVRLEPVFYSQSSFYTTDSQLAWRFVKAIKEASGATCKEDKRNSCKEFDEQSLSAQSSESQNIESDKIDLTTDAIKARMQNFFGTIGKKKGRNFKKILPEADTSTEPLVSGFVKLFNKSLSMRWHKMYCYINNGHFYAKKDLSDDYVEMAVPLAGALIGLPRKDSTKDLKIKIIQKDTKFMIEFSEMFEHATWIHMLLKETQVHPDKPSGIIYFENNVESQVEDPKQDSETNESIYANHSELMALMNSTTEIDEAPVTSSLNPADDISCPITPSIDESPYNLPFQTEPEVKIVKKAPPVAVKPNYAKRLVNKRSVDKLNEDDDDARNTNRENVVYSVVRKNGNATNKARKNDVIAEKNDVIRDDGVKPPEGFDAAPSAKVNGWKTPESTMKNISEDLRNGEGGRYVGRAAIADSPKPKPARTKPKQLNASHTNICCHDNHEETKLNKKVDIRMITLDDAELVKAAKSKPLPVDKNHIVLEKIMHFESEEEC